MKLKETLPWGWGGNGPSLGSAGGVVTLSVLWSEGTSQVMGPPKAATWPASTKIVAPFWQLSSSLAFSRLCFAAPLFLHEGQLCLVHEVKLCSELEPRAYLGRCWWNDEGLDSPPWLEVEAPSQGTGSRPIVRFQSMHLPRRGRRLTALPRWRRRLC